MHVLEQQERNPTDEAGFVCRWEGCPQEGRRFPQASATITHILYCHTTYRGYKCNCGNGFVSRDDLERHIQALHASEENGTHSLTQLLLLATH